MSIDEIAEALRNVRQAIVEADPDILLDTLWMPDSVEGGPGATVVDYIDQTLERLQSEISVKDAELAKLRSLTRDAISAAGLVGVKLRREQIKGGPR